MRNQNKLRFKRRNRTNAPTKVAGWSVVAVAVLAVVDQFLDWKIIDILIQLLQ